MAKGIFPTMTNTDIIASLNGWGMSVSSEQLLTPTPDFVENVYCGCLQQVTGLSHDNLRDPVQAALNAVEDQDLYAGALAHNLIVFHLTRFAQAARVEDFNARDISHPERARTLILLSAFINFVKFTEQWCNPFVKSIQDRSAATIAEREHVAEDLAEVTKKIEKLKAKIAEDEPKCRELEEQNNILRTHMFTTKERQTAAVQEVEKLKEIKSNLLKRKEILHDEIATVSESVVRTRSRIVQSPERIKRTISSMSSTAATDKKTVAMHEANARDIQAKINTLLAIERDIRSCIEQLQTIEKEVQTLSVSQKELADLKDNLDNKKIEKNQLELRRERVRKQLSNAEEKLERAQRHAEDKKLASQKTIDRLQKEYDAMAVERRDNDKQMEELRGEADEVESKMAEHLKKSEAELNELLAEYWKLRHETEVYMETLANKLNMRVSED